MTKSAALAMTQPIILLVALAVAGCRSGEPVPLLGTEGRAEGSAARVVGRAALPGTSLQIELLEPRRVAGNAVRVELVLVDPSPERSTDPATRATLGDAVATLSRASVVSADGRRRLFPLQDASARPLGTLLEPPAPGKRQSAWMVFAGHPPEAGPITLVLPGIPPFRNLAVR